MPSYPDTVCVIPARLESTRFPGKMLRKIGQETLIRRTVDNVGSSGLFPRSYVATDSLEIAKHVQEKMPVIITSSAPQSGTDRIVEALKTSTHLQGASIILNMQGDHPSVSHATMEALIKALRDNPKASIATAVFPCSAEIALKPQVVKCVFDNSGNALYFSRSPIPHKAKTYFHHIGLYAFRTDFLRRLPKNTTPLEEIEKLEQLRFLEEGYKIQVIVSNNEEDTWGVDTPEDAFDLEERLLAQAL